MKTIGFLVLAIGIYVIVDPKFVHIKNIANSDVKEFAGKLFLDKFEIKFNYSNWKYTGRSFHESWIA